MIRDPERTHEPIVVCSYPIVTCVGVLCNEIQNQYVENDNEWFQ
ncbi:MAG TPA: hypothetical protein VD710_04135 [Nitrososphaeraceae archaeon]|nr:hypothetical protein [Nitrososphaeraceae archaeon]